ncbi:unnamed protein product [Auanema sp. JU1783]|nr:unnamed protein product [Auanema sp. JU1783]
MEPIPEEGEEWVVPSSGNRKTVRKREIFTSEQVDTLISTVPKDTVPADWIVENEVIDPEMASSYMTESLAGPHSARGTTFSYTYESHYDNPPEEDEQAADGSGTHQTHKVTKVTKVTTTRSVRQIPVGSPYGDLYFDSSGLPTPSPVVEIDNAVEELGIRLRNTLEERGAPPPAPPVGSRYGNVPDDSQVPGEPDAPSIIQMGLGEVTISWSPPIHGSAQIIGYQIEMRDVPNGDWERAHDQLLRETTCTVTNLDTLGEIQFRVSAASRDGFGPPSAASLPVKVPMEYGHVPVGTSSVPSPPGKPSVISVDGHRATIQWAAPVVTSETSPIAGYQVEYRAFGAADWMIANDELIKDNIFTFDNLRPNGVYEFRVRAKSADGLGLPSKSTEPIHIKPAAPQRGISSRTTTSDIRPPGQPQLDEADMDWVKLEWSESSPGAGYIVEFREVGDPNWYIANPHPITQNCIQVEGLRPGSTYEFRVISVVGNSVSEPSEVSDVIALRPLWKSSGVKGAPERPQAPEYLEIDGDRITICWLPALSSLPVLGYDVEFRDFQQDVGWYKVNDQPVHACKMTVGDLIDGHDYQFRVLAHNVVGCSEPSEPSNPVTIKPSPGDAKFVEAERFGAVKLLQEEMIRESPPLPERDDSPPPLNRHPHNSGSLQWRDPTLKEVIDYLDSHDSHKQLNASGFLQHLTYSDDLVKDETRELGGIPKLIHLLKHENPAIQRNACACIKNLCFRSVNDKNKFAVLDADGVRLLAALLQTTHDNSVKEECTAALWNLSSSDMLKPAILKSATDVLVQQVVVPGAGFHQNGLVTGANGDPLKHYSSLLFKNATGVLRNISAFNTDARRQLRVVPNLIEGLVHFLTIAIERNQADSETVENVVCILRNLSYRIQEVEDPNYDPTP